MTAKVKPWQSQQKQNKMRIHSSILMSCLAYYQYIHRQCIELKLRAQEIQVAAYLVSLIDPEYDIGSVISIMHTLGLRLKWWCTWILPLAPYDLPILILYHEAFFYTGYICSHTYSPFIFRGYSLIQWICISFSSPFASTNS